MKVSPVKIEKLGYPEVFVFGSNLAGIHGAGAAEYAYRNFGAVWGCGKGFQGRCYAIPTKNWDVKSVLPLETIRGYVHEFLGETEKLSALTYFVTRIGCGFSGYTDAEIAPLFIREGKEIPPNVALPATFWKVLQSQGN